MYQDFGTYWSFNVTLLAGAGVCAPHSAVISYVKRGTSGSSGSSGISGSSGSSGTSGSSGSSGISGSSGSSGISGSSGTSGSSGLTFTGNTSGGCISDIYVSAIHSCYDLASTSFSPLLINPLNEANVIFGSASGITITLSDPSILISGNTSTSKLNTLSQGTGGTINLNTSFLYNAASGASNEHWFMKFGGSSAIPLNITGDTKIIDMKGYAYVNGSSRLLSSISMGGTSLSASSYNGYISFKTSKGISGVPTERMLIDDDGTTKIYGVGYSSTIPVLSLGLNDEISFYSKVAGIPDNITFDSFSSYSSLELHNGTSGTRRNLEFIQASNYCAITGNESTASTNNAEMYIINAGNLSMVFRVNTNKDALYLLNTGNTQSVFSGTGAAVVYLPDYLEADNIALRSVGSDAFVNNINISSTGKLTTATSDERLKENIKPLSGSLNTLLGLSGVTYQWIDKISGGDDERFGFIAQQVESVEPKLVFTNKVDGYKGLKSDCFTPLIVESIKELHNNPSIPIYTPINSTDTNGEIGNITSDDNYLYIKTNMGWKRTSLETF